MKKLLLITFMLVPLLSFAQTEKLCLVVWQKNGQKVFYDLEEEPHTTFAPGRLVITTSTLRTEYVLSEVLRYTYEGATAAIATTEAGGMGFSQHGDDIAIHGLTKGTKALLYDVRGILLESAVSDGQSSLHFSLASHPIGTYIVKLGDHSLKFIKQ